MIQLTNCTMMKNIYFLVGFAFATKSPHQHGYIQRSLMTDQAIEVNICFRVGTNICIELKIIHQLLLERR